MPIGQVVTAVVFSTIGISTKHLKQQFFGGLDMDDMDDMDVIPVK